MHVDSLSLVEDLEVNDGSETRPYFMTKSLRKVMNKQNKIPENNITSMEPSHK